ncbi:class II aldolase and Adducin N-terminal domain-containing protein [Coniochaeta sp. 2T2.1]|nr:class II aldolase and Adducin N-terminal domain-containing protein [Coniochaeta sp. 2T2.1]
MPLPDPQSALLSTFIRTFITASHILHHHAVLDAYGHLSFRHPSNTSTFFMSRNTAPATVSSPEDVIEYRVSDASPIDPSAPQGYAERHIHSEIYKRHPSVTAAVHSHSEAVVPFTVSGVPLRPVYHMAGFLPADGAPVFEIGEHYGEAEEEARDMLVKNERLGAVLAREFDGGVAVVLMRGQGFTVVAEEEGGMQEVVLRAVYTQKNAAIQSSAVMLRSAYEGAGGGWRAGEVRYLDEEECKGATDVTRWSAQRPWKLWVREVEASGLYVNSSADKHSGFAASKSTKPTSCPFAHDEVMLSDVSMLDSELVKPALSLLTAVQAVRSGSPRALHQVDDEADHAPVFAFGEVA